MFMFGNILQVSGVTDRLAKTASDSFMDILTILLGIAVGSSMPAETFLKPQTLLIFALGIVAFACATAAGVLLGKLMNKLSKEPVNPMIGAAGVSAVPMAARVVQKMGQKENPRNFLLMHAMGPNIAGVIGTAVAAGTFLTLVGSP
jgi:oxaloacetate decarboxylase beta subunit